MGRGHTAWHRRRSPDADGQPTGQRNSAISTKAARKSPPRRTINWASSPRERLIRWEVPGDDWSNWSAPYEASGAEITSPSPRRFLQLRARLLSDDPRQAASLNAIRVNFVAPLARQILGELEPGNVEELGTEQVLSLFVKPIGQTQPFDEILLRAPAGMDLQFQQLRLGREAQWASDEAETSTQVQILPTGSDSLWLRLEQAVAPGAIELLEVQFATTLFTPGALFPSQSRQFKPATIRGSGWTSRARWMPPNWRQARAWCWWAPSAASASFPP